MEERLLAKLLSDKKLELAAYDQQLEEYCRLSTQRAAAGVQPLLPAFSGSRGVLPGGVSASSAAAALAAPRQAAPGGVGASQKQLLEKLLAEKKAELAAATSEVQRYSQLLEARTAAATPAPLPSAAVTALSADPAAASLEERVQALEAMLMSELKRKEEQMALNEELLRINQEQVTTNEELVRKLQAVQGGEAVVQGVQAVQGSEPGVVARAAAAAAAARAATAAPAEGPAVGAQPAVVYRKDELEKDAAYKKLGSVLDGPSGLAVVALGLASAFAPAASAAVNAVQDAVNNNGLDGR